MVRKLAVIGMWAVGALCAAAQEVRPYNGDYYGFYTVGQCQHGVQITGGGGGAEALVWKGLTVGAEFGYQSFTGSSGFGMLTPQFGYHFVDRKKPGRWDPFVTMGAGFAFSHGTASAINFGGGVTYWAKPRFGIRVEYRAHVLAYEEGINAVRFGVAFR